MRMTQILPCGRQLIAADPHVNVFSTEVRIAKSNTADFNGTISLNREINLLHAVLNQLNCNRNQLARICTE